MNNARPLLRLGGLVSFRREGKRNFYRLDSPLARELLRWFRARNGGEGTEGTVARRTSGTR